MIKRPLTKMNTTYKNFISQHLDLWYKKLCAVIHGCMDKILTLRYLAIYFYIFYNMLHACYQLGIIRKKVSSQPELNKLNIYFCIRVQCYKESENSQGISRNAKYQSMYLSTSQMKYLLLVRMTFFSISMEVLIKSIFSN